MNNPRVMFDSQEPIERSDDSGAALPSTTCTFPATEKTKEKRCFISHSSEDAEWIKEMITKLEKENDIRCIYAERDFYPGKPILDNIVTSIRNSTIIIVALSPAFLDSRFCEYETQMALMEHLTTAPKQIVSIRLKE
uniref:Toll-like receptor 6-like n=1 Tax=Saccoglossus kowalevskii TaxID=10224 RepID=A0ABM0M1L1_SACKO|nr:PREDICTED: toll-like receptor 6-like [Saccoglossus kowalevskii]